MKFIGSLTSFVIALSCLLGRIYFEEVEGIEELNRKQGLMPALQAIFNSSIPQRQSS